MESEPQRGTGGSSPAILNNSRRATSNTNPLFQGSSVNVLTETSSVINPERVIKQQTIKNENVDETMQNEGHNYTIENDWEQTNLKLHHLRRIILEELLQYIPRLRNIGKRIILKIKEKKLICTSS